MRLFAALLATTAIVGLATVTASAADLPRGPVYKAPVAIPLYNWSGLYIGANIGWGWGSGSGTATIGGITGPTSGSGNGFLGGAQIGYNMQAGAWVFGLETDFQGSGGESTVTGPNATTATAKGPWFGTIRGRLGYAFDRSLLYVTGGGVYGRANLDGTSGGVAFSSSTTAWSWTLGGGLEQALWDRWSAKLEYLYVGSPNKVPVPPATTAVSGDSHGHIVRAGLNYRF